MNRGLIILFILVAFVLLPYAFCVNWKPNPSDAELFSDFEQSEDRFLELAALAHANPNITRVGMTDAYVSDGGQTERIRNEERFVFHDEPLRRMGLLLDSLGLLAGMTHCPESPHQLFFYKLCRGLHPYASCKGYVWSSEPLDPVLESLDSDPPPALDEDGRAYKTISDEWHIFYERWKGVGIQCLTARES